MDKERFEYGFCVWLLVMEWKVMFSLLLEFFSPPLSRVGGVVTVEAALGLGGRGEATWPWRAVAGPFPAN